MSQKNFVKNYNLENLPFTKNLKYTNVTNLSELYQSSPHKKINILTLDGGGTRGLFMLEILREICIKFFGSANEMSTKKFVQLFDLIGGTSTGAIIGVALSCGYSIDEIIKMYYQIIDTIFYESWIIAPYRWYRYLKSGDYYDQKALTMLFQEIFKNKKISDIQSNVFVTTVNATKTNWIPFLFRSYNGGNQLIDGANDGYIHDILTASTAAPVYFGPTFYNKQKINFEHSGIIDNMDPLEFNLNGTEIETLALIDGGCCVNNPTELAIFEALALYPDSKLNIVLSIGSGTPRPEKNSFTIQNIIYNLIDVATNSEETDVNILRWINSHKLDINYFRFSTPGLGFLRLDTSNKMYLENGLILTNRYMESRKNEINKLKNNINNDNIINQSVISSMKIND